MRFQYRFEFLLDLRRTTRDEAGIAVGQATEAIGKIESEISEIRVSLAGAREQQTAQRMGEVCVERMLATNRYEMQLAADIQSLNQTLVTLGYELQKRQQALAAAEAEVKKLERFREKELKEFNAEVSRREQIELDDRTSARYTRRRQAQEKRQRSVMDQSLMDQTLVDEKTGDNG